MFFQHFEIHFFYYVSLICYSILKILFQSFQGSGKTLVYAAPIVSQLKDETEDGFINRLSRPRALVIAPSRELASQILVKKNPLCIMFSMLYQNYVLSCTLLEHHAKCI